MNDSTPLPDRTARTSTLPDGGADVLLRARGLRVRVPGRTLIEQVNLEIRPGDRVALLGPSGCGKSQLLDRLLGLTPTEPEDGMVERGYELPAPPRPDAANAPSSDRDMPLGMVFQTNALFDTLTVRQNIAVGSGKPHHAGAGDAAAEWIRAVGMHPERDGGKYPAELSGGMQRRVALARALAARPRLLVLDEPLVGLDGESLRIVTETVARAYRESQGAMAVLVVTHDYPFAIEFCDRVLWIHPDRRRVEEVGEWRDLDLAARKNRIESLLRDAGAKAARDAVGADTPERRRPWWEGLRRTFAGYLPPRNPLSPSSSLGALVLGFLHGPFAGIRPGRDFLEHWTRACILAVPYVGLIFSLLGLLLVLQGERMLGPYGLASRIPEAVTRGILEGIGPLLLALLMGGRSGSAMAADLGAQRFGRQVDQWRLLGRDPAEVLFAPRAWALVLALPLLYLLGVYIALGTGWLFYSLIPQAGLTARAFWEGARQYWELLPTLHGMTRVALDGAVLASIAYVFGTSPKQGPEDIAEGSTRTVVYSAIAFLMIEVAWTAFGAGR